MKPLFNIDPLFKELSIPLHNKLIRNTWQNTDKKVVDISEGYCLNVPDCESSESLKTCLKDFHRFMSIAMGVKRNRNGYGFLFNIASPYGCPENVSEAFAIEVSKERCVINAKDIDGFRRAVVYLEDEMTLRRAPFLPIGSVVKWAGVSVRISRSPIAPYRWLSGWELEDNRNYYPDEYLNKLAHCGINGLWVPGLFRKLIASKILPELGPEQHQLGKLKKIIDKNALYGIKTYLFCIEPRAVPDDHPVFAAHPEIKGAKLCETTSAICTSTALVKDYIRETAIEIFKTLPDLGGVINLFNGERGTTCWLNESMVKTCPRCSMRSQSDVLSEELTCFHEGMRSVNKTAKLMAFTYVMGDSASPASQKNNSLFETINKSPQDIIWLSNFEHGGQKQLGGKTFEVQEYSLAYTGPARPFAEIAGYTKHIGRKSYAKLQLGTTYEMSSVPYVPVPGVVYDKFEKMHEMDISGTMLSWIVGGYPSLMLKAAGEASFAPLPDKDAFLVRLSGIYWGRKNASDVVRAWNKFAEAYNAYPCAIEVFYDGPITRSPAYQLHLEQEDRIAWPYNWEIDFRRQIQPYEDKISRWCGPFKPEAIIEYFRISGNFFEEGLKSLAKALSDCGQRRDLEQQYAVAGAIAVQFLSTANVYEFYLLRDKLKNNVNSSSEQGIIIKRMETIALSDIALARRMKFYLEKDSFIGFQSEIYEYSYSQKLIDEKIAQVLMMLKTLKRWKKQGIDFSVFNQRISAEIEFENVRHQSDYDRWLDWWSRNHILSLSNSRRKDKMPSFSYKEWLAAGD